MMVLQLVWVKTMVVETKGVPLEQIQECLNRPEREGGAAFINRCA
jgi:hypothetical protein